MLTHLKTKDEVFTQNCVFEDIEIYILDSGHQCMYSALCGVFIGRTGRQADKDACLLHY